jgi:putative ABC transport system ATP-binding protein
VLAETVPQEMAPVGAAPADPVLELRSVGLVYPGPPPVEALKDCSLRVEPGEFVTVVGPSGSGKSTLLNVLGLLDRPTSGEYWLSGIETSTLTEAQRAGARGAWLGFVFQSFHLVPHRSATENVALGLLYSGLREKERLAKARQVLADVGLADRSEAASTQLSGGERQRVAIARALVRSPEVLLCDEPTGNLDQTTAGNVMELIVDLHRSGQTVILITHDPLIASRGQRQISLRDGLVGEVIQ